MFNLDYPWSRLETGNGDERTDGEEMVIFRYNESRGEDTGDRKVQAWERVGWGNEVGKSGGGSLHQNGSLTKL